MPEQSYKILAAKKLGIDPAELLMYFEFKDHAYATTPDGGQHVFTYASLVRADPRVSPPAPRPAPVGVDPRVDPSPVPAKDLAEKAQKVPGSPSAAPSKTIPEAKSIAPKKPKK